MSTATRASNNPRITSVEQRRVYWRGSAGAASYTVQRALRARGPWVSVCARCVTDRSNGYPTPKAGWYELIRPVNISEYGTLTQREWLGSPKSLPTVMAGDLAICSAIDASGPPKSSTRISMARIRSGNPRSLF